MTHSTDQTAKFPTSYVSVDTETTGLYPMYGDKIIQLSAIKYIDDKLVDTFDTLINPDGSNNNAKSVNNISESSLKNQPTFDEVIGDFVNFVEDLPWVGHNLSFDFSFLKSEELKIASFKKNSVDTLQIARSIYGNKGNKLQQLAKKFNIDYKNLHNSLYDAQIAASLYQHLRSVFQTNKCKKINKKDIDVTNNSLSGAHFAFTGSFKEFPDRKEITKLIIKNGGYVPNGHRCTSVTDFLILGKPTARNLTDKANKRRQSMINALKYNTNIITANEFISMLGEK
ncbi:exonuclease domain-containing protein [Limosilactobacillus reuteri]|uniref:DNA polymerase III polC-type n=1 Tax=Limosilactobacillus reuteri subsp. rodentium (strain DSM 17509 / CIP 109821 / 100-23) TaxID=349123 RepID=B3XRZ2_LIMR1|nr:exonuclease domain-containing protein [Limosilactobacillus reuteri]EDX41566.1 DNA polymerase III, epsilon subunit [Limosilactobacillus reuteri subsp. rodentium]MCC4475263.1 3'-5' exonuclease [Limosilactobacillus reuteri]